MLEILETPMTVLHVLACAFLMLVVLLQPGRSGGMGAFTGAATQQVFGGRGAGNMLTKATWVTAGIFFVSSMTLAYMSSSTGDTLQERAQETVDDTVDKGPGEEEQSGGAEPE